jgi:hypothetical protein
MSLRQSALARLENDDLIVQPGANKSTQKKQNNRKIVIALFNEGYTRAQVSKIAKLNYDTVCEIIKRVEQGDLTNPHIVSLAYKALCHNLKNNNMQAVKMVYDRKHPVIQITETHKTTDVRSVLVKLDNLSNPEAAGLLKEKMKERGALEALEVKEIELQEPTEVKEQKEE